MKKTVSIILSLAIIATMALSGLYTPAGENVYKSSCGQYADYEINKDTGLLTVNGVGLITAHKDLKNDLYYGNVNPDFVKSIVISEGVTMINERLFNYLKCAESITLPKSLKRICSNAFDGCSSLKTVNYGGNEKEFSKIKLDENNEAIINAKKNYNIAIFKADNYDYYISLFQSDLCTSVKAGSNITCQLNYYTGIMKIEGKGETFDFSKGNSLNFLASLYKDNEEAQICANAFADEIIVSEGITKINSSLFENFNRVKAVKLPKSLKSIGGYSFYRCDSLQNVYYAGNYADWKNIKIAEDNDELLKAKVHFASKVSAKSLTYTLSETGRAYDGKSHTPTVTVKDKYGRRLKKGTDYTVTMDGGRKAVGKYKVFIKLKGEYTGQKTMYFTIKPKGTSISKINARKKGFTVIWKTQKTQTDGYQVQYSTSSNFTNPKTITLKKNTNYAKKITNLKSKKKYYVRVRTYKTVTFKGEPLKIYSGWSKAKAVTTK